MPQVNRQLVINKYVWLILPAILVVVLGVVLYIAYVKNADNTSFAKTKNDATNAMYSGRLVNAESLWRKYIGKALTSEHKSYAWQQLAVVQVNEQKYADAVASYHKAETFGQLDFSGQDGLAVAAERAGDKATALEYYKRALSTLQSLKSDDPYRAAHINDLKEHIKSLGGSV